MKDKEDNLGSQEVSGIFFIPMSHFVDLFDKIEICRSNFSVGEFRATVAREDESMSVTLKFDLCTRKYEEYALLQDDHTHTDFLNFLQEIEQISKTAHDLKER